jgi:hypothetical protein
MKPDLCTKILLTAIAVSLTWNIVASAAPKTVHAQTGYSLIRVNLQDGRLERFFGRAPVTESVAGFSCTEGVCWVVTR